jgi:tRNA(fMet)-specific endonuclease VapC
MSFLFDTDVVDALYGRPEAIDLVSQLRAEGICVSTISLMEIIEGIEAGRTPDRARRGLRSFMRRTRVLVVSRSVALRAATIRVDLRRRKRQVNERVLDIIVAAPAIEHGLTLITRIRHHYDDIADLRLYDDYPPLAPI